MRIDKGQISGSRFMFTVACFLQSSALLTSFIAGVTKQDSWFPVLSGIVVCLPLVYLFRTLMVMFPDKNFMEMLEAAFGRVAGKALGVAYIWFFLTLAALNLKDLGDFTKVTVLQNTPHVVLTVMCALVSAMAVRHGIKVVARYGALFTIIEFFIVAASLVLLLDHIRFRNFLPMFTLPAIKYVQSTHIIATIPFGELVVFLMLTPNIRMERRDAAKYWFFGVGMGMLTLLVVLLRDISVLGNTIHLFALPGLVTLRLAYIGEALSRIEILFAVALILLLFFKITLLCYVSTIAVAQFVKTPAYKRLALVVSALVVAYVPTLYPNSVEHAASGRDIVPFAWTVFEIFIPLALFAVAKWRKLGAAQSGVKEQGV